MTAVTVTGCLTFFSCYSCCDSLSPRHSSQHAEKAISNNVFSIWADTSSCTIKYTVYKTFGVLFLIKHSDFFYVSRSLIKSFLTFFCQRLKGLFLFDSHKTIISLYRNKKNAAELRSKLLEQNAESLPVRYYWNILQVIQILWKPYVFVSYTATQILSCCSVFWCSCQGNSWWWFC